MLKLENHFMKNSRLLSGFISVLVILVIAVAVTGCADTVNVQKCLPEDPYGFFGGFWHGMITPFSFIGSFFSSDIAVYAVNNTGGWYDFGFLLGIGGIGVTIKVAS